MSAVLDASVLVAAVADSTGPGKWAESVLAEGDLVAPHLVLVEASNILRRLERAKILSSAEAAAAHADLMRIDLVLLPFEPFAARVWELRRNITAYDAWYVAAAEAFQFPLATLDRRLSRATGPSCRFRLPK